MAAQTTVISALLALLAISMVHSTATAATNNQLYCPPPMTAMAAMEPCRQYLMRELGMTVVVASPATMPPPPPSPVLRQQCCLQLQAMMPRCQCDAMCQMMQLMQQDLAVFPAGEQQMMAARLREMAAQLPYMCGTAPTFCRLFPGPGGC